MEKTFVVRLPVFGPAVIEPFDADNSYKQISEAVGGMIERAVIPQIKHTGEYGIDCFVDEEGILKELPPNYRLTDLCKECYGGLLVGDAIFVAHNYDGETVGLNAEDAAAIENIFQVKPSKYKKE